MQVRKKENLLFADDVLACIVNSKKITYFYLSPPHEFAKKFISKETIISWCAFTLLYTSLSPDYLWNVKRFGCLDTPPGYSLKGFHVKLGENWSNQEKSSYLTKLYTQDHKRLSYSLPTREHHRNWEWVSRDQRCGLSLTLATYN